MNLAKGIISLLLSISVFLAYSIVAPVQQVHAAGLLLSGALPGSLTVSGVGGVAAAVVAIGACIYLAGKYDVSGRIISWAYEGMSNTISYWRSMLGGVEVAQLDMAGQEYLDTGCMSVPYLLNESMRNLSPFCLPFTLPDNVYWGSVDSKPGYIFEYSSSAEIAAAAFMALAVGGSASMVYYVPSAWVPAGGWGAEGVRYNVYEVNGDSYRVLNGNDWMMYFRCRSNLGSNGSSFTTFDGKAGWFAWGSIGLEMGKTALGVWNGIAQCVRNFRSRLQTRVDERGLSEVITVVDCYEYPDPYIFNPEIVGPVSVNIPVVDNLDGTYTIDIPTDIVSVAVEGIHTGPDPYAGSVEPGVDYSGILGSIFALLQGLATAIASAISAVFVGDWSSVDLAPLELVFQNVSTKFPFSLPWDFQRLANVFAVAAQEAPSFSLAMPGGIWGTGNLAISFPDEFLQFFGWIRWALVIVWDIGLLTWVGSWFGAGEK
jgi:hypothetical protein